MPESPISLIKLKPDTGEPDFMPVITSTFEVQQFIQTWAQEAYARQMILQIVVGFEPFPEPGEPEESDQELEHSEDISYGDADVYPRG